MRILLLLFLLFGDCKRPESATDSTIVYICDSSGGKKYHLDPNCKGLHSCSHKIVRLTLEQAKKRGKTLCGYEK
jgi:hypothetical protein